MGAGKGKWLPKFNEYLRDRDCVLLPDNDDDGRKHMQVVAASLSGVARSIKIVELPGLPAKGDVSDWLAIHPTLNDLLALVERTPKYKTQQAITKPEYKPDDPPNIYSNLCKELVDPPQYLITIGDVTVKIGSFSALLDHKKVRLACGEQHNWLPEPIKPKEWERLIRKLLEQISELVKPGEASASGLLWSFIVEQLETRNNDAEAQPDGTPVERAGWVYFKPKDLAGQLGTARGAPKVKPAALWAVVEQHGGIECFRKFDGKPYRVWGLPVDALDSAAHGDEEKDGTV
jgi:hypothetical protein